MNKDKLTLLNPNGPWKTWKIGDEFEGFKVTGFGYEGQGLCVTIKLGKFDGDYLVQEKTVRICGTPYELERTF